VVVIDAYFRPACLQYFTFKFQKYGYLCNAMEQLSMLHYWLFAVKYLESGINCSGFFDQPISRRAYSLMLAAGVPFIVALFCLQIVLFLTYPVLEPAPDAGVFACELMYKQHMKKYEAWYAGTYANRQQQINIVGTVYIWASIIVTLLGMGMLWQSYRRISKQNQFTSLNTSQMTVHVLAMLFFSTAVILNFFSDSVTFNIITNSLSGSFMLLLCYIVWTQASSDKLTQYEMVVQRQHDGSSKFLLRLVS
jgi:hypothetical protein